MKEYNPVLWNQDLVSIFSETYFGSFLSNANVEEEIVIEDRPLLLMYKNKKRYLLQHDMEKFLPIIPTKIDKVFHKNKLYHHITEFKSARFKEEKHYSFRDFVDEFMNVKHSNPQDFLLYKIIVLSAYLERINFRVATEPAFGKGVPILLLEHLRKDVSLINPRSMAAVEYRLVNKMIVLDEISNLESAQRKLLQEFLLLAGDFKNVYEKSTRGTSKYGTQDAYPIHALSLGVTYNTIDCYKDQNQDDNYFDKVFQDAVMDRFIPFKFEGTVDVKQFQLIQDKYVLAEKHKQYYIDFIRTIEYYKKNYIKEMEEKGIIKNNKFIWPTPAVGGLLKGRQQASFEKITRFLALYSNDEKEFQMLCNMLLSKVRSYYIMLNNGMVSLTSVHAGATDNPAEFTYDKQPEKDNNFSKVVKINSKGEEEEDILQEIDMLFRSSDKTTAEGYPVEEFIKLFGEDKMNELILNQELILNKNTYLQRLK